MDEKKPLIILTGPTASGKTELSVRLAKKIGAEIISADSVQVYKYMDIGSAKVTKEEMDGVRHYLVDELPPDADFNVYEFKKLAEKYAGEIRQKALIPIVAGGTGFYIQALLYDVDFSEEENDGGYRTYLQKLADEKGPEYIFKILKKEDEEAAAAIHPNNVKRVIRALEYKHLTGEKISLHNERERAKTSKYNFRYFVLDMPRNLLYERIERRVDKMFEAGLIGEVGKLLDMGYDRNLVSMQGIGYKETAAYLAGEISLDEAVYLIKRDTRRFAKRQMTWFRREKSVTLVDYEKFDFDKEKILDFLVSESEKVTGDGKKY